MEPFAESVTVPERLKINHSDDPSGQKLLQKIKNVGPDEPDYHWSVIRSTVVYAKEGWVRFDGSQERMYFGPECTFALGDRVKITFEKQEEADATK